jgi:hypothetical protein
MWPDCLSLGRNWKLIYEKKIGMFSNTDCIICSDRPCCDPETPLTQGSTGVDKTYHNNLIIYLIFVYRCSKGKQNV